MANSLADPTPTNSLADPTPTPTLPHQGGGGRVAAASPLLPPPLWGRVGAMERTLLKKPIRINGLTGRDGASCSTDLKHEEVACFQGFLAIWRASKHERSVNPIGVREGGASAPISRIWPTPTPARPRQGGGGRNEGGWACSGRRLRDGERRLHRLVDGFQPYELQALAGLLGDVVVVAPVAGRQHHLGDAGMHGGQHLLLDAAHRQHEAPQADLAG